MNKRTNQLARTATFCTYLAKVEKFVGYFYGADLDTCQLTLTGFLYFQCFRLIVEFLEDLHSTVAARDAVFFHDIQSWN